MPSLLTIDTIKTITKTNYTVISLDAIFDYISKTGETEFYLMPKLYWSLGKNSINVSQTLSGQTDDGSPYFQVLGIKFILICGDRLAAYNLLKESDIDNKPPIVMGPTGSIGPIGHQGVTGIYGNNRVWEYSK